MNSPLLGNFPKGLLFVISAPAGTGKTTLARMLTEEFSQVVESISFTTRPPRPGEVEGRDYHFIRSKEFKEKIQAGDFLEYATVFGHDYGTSSSYVQQLLSEGKHVLLVIDTQGALQLMGKVNAIFIFICPPNLQELRKRLSYRRSDSEQSIEERLSWAAQEIERASKYDYIVINHHLSRAYETLRSIMIAEEHRTQNIAKNGQIPHSSRYV